jgi:hypothetical protein
VASSRKALFNIVLGFAGVEFEGSNLLRFTEWGGLIPQAIRLVQEVGSIGEATSWCVPSAASGVPWS